MGSKEVSVRLTMAFGAYILTYCIIYKCLHFIVKLRERKLMDIFGVKDRTARRYSVIIAALQYIYDHNEETFLHLGHPWTEFVEVNILIWIFQWFLLSWSLLWNIIWCKICRFFYQDWQYSFCFRKLMTSIHLSRLNQIQCPYLVQENIIFFTIYKKNDMLTVSMGLLPIVHVKRALVVLVFETLSISFQEQWTENTRIIPWSIVSLLQNAL